MSSAKPPGILLTGANGQIGADLALLLPPIADVTAVTRSRLDLARPAEIRRAVRELRPQWIVNAAAYTAVDLAEKGAALARAVNAEAPAVLAEEAAKIGAALVHFSTDYVFDGAKNSPYVEDDPPHPLSVYGKTKLAGEIAIRDSGVPHLLFRTAWVYSTRGRNFLLTILRLAAEREELRIVNDQRGAPTSSRQIALATAKILAPFFARDPRASLASVSGTYHMTAAGETTWFEFARAILDEASGAPSYLPWLAAATSGRPLIARRVVPITTAEYPTPARRPAYSVLSNARLHSAFKISLPPWRDQLHSAFLNS